MAEGSVQSTASKAKSLFGHVVTWPPLVYYGLGVICLGIWLAGTAVQVQTSEAWIMSQQVDSLQTIATLGQIVDFVRGTLPARFVVPFVFGWGVQLALILVSVGIELPRYPAWRYYGCWIVSIGLIGVNSCGDFVYSGQYGTWGQVGFTLVILFLTFCTGLLAIMCFLHGSAKMKTSPS